MLKKKFKFLFALIAIIMLISTLSFATEIQPRTVEGEDIEFTSEDQTEIQPRTSEDEDVEFTSEDQTEIQPRASEDDGISFISETDGAGIIPTSEDDVEEIADFLEEDPSLRTTDNDLYLFKDTVKIDNIINGNVFIIANEVFISGEIDGDVFIIANKVTIDGSYFYNSLFITAKEISFNGIVFDVYAVSQNFTLEESGYIYRDLKAFSPTITLNGKIRRDAYLSTNNINFNEENGFIIGGNLHYTSTNKLDISEELVQGEILYTSEIVSEKTTSSKIKDYILDAINSLVFIVALVALATWLAPKFVDKISSMDTKKSIISLGVGILTFIAGIVAIVLLLISQVGVHVAFASAGLFIAICMAGTAFASIYFTSLFTKFVKWDGKLKFIASSAIVALVLWVVRQIPYIGDLFGFVVAIFGIGVLVMNILPKKNKTTSKK